MNVTRGDFERLQPGKYLNDTLIEFGLKYVWPTVERHSLRVFTRRLWLSDIRDCNPELADQIHLFSSFFYKKLAIKE